jgi:hypothetical protein
MKLRDRSATACRASTATPSRALPGGARGVALPLLAVLCLLVGAAEADIPTAADFAECNREAKDRPEGRSSSPTSKDKAEAEAARGRGGSGGDAPGTGSRTPSEDPQLAGVDGEGAKDAAYRAAYRVCMRRKGF